MTNGTASRQPGASASREIVRTSFDGHPVTAYVFRRRGCWIAAEVGAALDYSEVGFRSSLREWAEELIEGKDFDVLRGSDLAEFKALPGQSAEIALSRARGLRVFYEPGVNLVCLKTEKRAGRRLRRLLADEVMPKLRRGEPVMPSGEHAAIPEELLAAMRVLPDLLQRLVDLEERVATVAGLQSRAEHRGPELGPGAARLHVLDPLRQIARVKARAIKSENPRTLRSLRFGEERRLRAELLYPMAVGQGWERFPRARLGEALCVLARMKGEADRLAQIAAGPTKQMQLKLVRPDRRPD